MDDIVTGERSVCVYCGERIGAVIDPHSGVVDWGSYFPGRGGVPEDFGCGEHPDNDDEGCGSHDPGPDHTPCGFQTRPRS